MADYTEAQLKAAARKAMAGGDAAAAQKLFEMAQALPKTGMTPEQKARIEAAKAGTLPRGDVSPDIAARQADFGQYAQTGDIGVGRAAAIGLGQGGTFGAGDEIVAGAKSILGPNSYDQNLALQRAFLDQARKQHPVAAYGGEIGGSMAVPLGSVGGGSLAMRAAKSAGVGAGLGSVYGFNTGEGMADRLTGAVQGGVVGGAIGGVTPLVGSALSQAYANRANNRAVNTAIKNAPSIDELRAGANAAYKRVENAGVSVDQGALASKVDDILAGMRKTGLDEGGGALSLTPQSARLADVMTETATAPSKGISFGDLEVLRRKAGIPAYNIKNKVEASMGSQAISGLDDFVNGLAANPSHVVGGDASNIAADIAAARDAYARMSRSQLIQDAIEAGGGNYLSGGSSGIRNQFKNLLRNKKLMRGFSDMEKAAMRKVINGSIPEQALNLAASGLGQMATVGAGAAVGHIPGALAGGAVAAGARKLSEAVTTKKAEGVMNLIASGLGRVEAKKMPETLRALIEAKLRQAAIPGAAPMGQALQSYMVR